MRRKKSAKVRMRDALLDTFQSSIVSKLRNRHMLLCPFPLDPMALYRKLWSEQQWEGLMSLETVEHLFRKKTSLHLRIPLVPDTPREEGVRVSITLPAELPMGSGEMDYTRLTEEEQAMVRSWIVDWRQFQKDTDEVESTVTYVVQACSTIGQVVRIWPDLLGFMRSDQQEEVQRKASRSPYPREVMEWEWREGVGKQYTGLKPDFRPERFTALRDVIAEALMLPEYDDLTHIATHQWEEPKR